MAFWQRDGRELYYLAADRGIMAVPVTLSPDFEFGKPKLLFRPPESMPLAAGAAMISRDGERVLVAVPPPQLRQLTVFDRQGKVLSTVGQPALLVQPGMSPDGKSVVVMKNDTSTGNQDIWVYDLATGNGTAITQDTPPDNAPIWPPTANTSRMYRRERATPLSIESLPTERVRKSCYSVTHRVPGWSSPIGHRMQSSSRFTPECCCLYR